MEATTLEPRTRPGKRKKSKPHPASPWNVVLLDDDDHSYAYVVEMLGELFGHPLPSAWRLAREVDGVGRVVVWSGKRSEAERGRERIHAYGADPRIPRSRGSMSAILERAR